MTHTSNHWQWHASTVNYKNVNIHTYMWQYTTLIWYKNCLWFWSQVESTFRKKKKIHMKGEDISAIFCKFRVLTNPQFQTVLNSSNLADSFTFIKSYTRIIKKVTMWCQLTAYRYWVYEIALYYIHSKRKATINSQCKVNQ